MSHTLAFNLFLFSGWIKLASTMGDDAMVLMIIGSLVTLPRLIPGIILQKADTITPNNNI